MLLKCRESSAAWRAAMRSDAIQRRDRQKLPGTEPLRQRMISRSLIAVITLAHAAMP